MRKLLPVGALLAVLALVATAGADQPRRVTSAQVDAAMREHAKEQRAYHERRGRCRRVREIQTRERGVRCTYYMTWRDVAGRAQECRRVIAVVLERSGAQPILATACRSV